MFCKKKKYILLCYISLLVISNTLFAQKTFPDLEASKSGKVSFISDDLGNNIPDFSYAGYKASEAPIPNIETKIFIPELTGDATKQIQAAIDYVSRLKPNKSGFRGTVLLDKGIFKIEGTLYIKTSGVVLRGSGNAEDETLLLGTGIKREALIRVLGKDDKIYKDTLDIEPAYTPLGAQTISLKNTAPLQVSDNVIIHKPITNAWITLLGMEAFGGETAWIGWKPRDWDMVWRREITAVNGQHITLSAPLTAALNNVYGEAKVITYDWPGRITGIGIENLSMASTYDTANMKDEQHRWQAISMENVKDAWVRQVNFKHFSGGAVALLKSTQQITVEDCIATEPVSEIAAFRRYTFYTEGQQTLFQRCYSEHGYHDFAVGGLGTTGPNAFVQCESHMPYHNSGAIGSWATGVLFDIAYIDGKALSYNNREQDGRGAGWTAANSVIWESSASKIACYSPPTSQNWAFGVWGQFAGNGHWKDVNNHISPRSLFYAQLKTRLGELPVNPYIFDLGTEPTSSPTVAQAAALTKQAKKDLKSLPEWIEEVSQLNAIPVNALKVKSVNDLKLKNDKESKLNSTSEVANTNGWLTYNGDIISGKQSNVMWWRGSFRKRDVKRASHHVTRFAPGKRGKGYTDNLKTVVNDFKASNTIALNHNYGLWYDRRMDDHERTRRIDADVWPPFYEQPFARTGQGLAWDHLSKYDLTKFNTWYWDRLARFADLAESEGQLLIHQQYFQHSILEAGAHWSSSPWRDANNVNQTGFPEPPPYAGDKRIFIAEQFYDITHPVRKKLHQQYIRKGFENFQDNSNVIQFTSAEYTGPLHFMQFWIDEAQRWKDETDKNSIIGLSATKDVQDAILKDKKRLKTVDLIDIKYWHYRSDGSLYAPEGGKNLAPRQFARKIKVGKETEAQAYRAVRFYREQYPDKMVMYSTKNASKLGWAVLMAGGSLPNIPKVNINGFYKILPQMTFSSTEDFNSKSWSLQQAGQAYLFYLRETKTITINLSKYKGTFEVYWIAAKDGTIHSRKMISGLSKQELKAPLEGTFLAYIKKR